MSIYDKGHDIVDQIFRDFRAGDEAFENDGLRWPLERYLDEFDFSNSFQFANYLMLTGALNRNRTSEVLREKTLSLWRHESWIFDPRRLVGEERKSDLEDIFAGEGTYMEASTLGSDWGGTRLGSGDSIPNSDSAPWWDLSKILYEEYHSSSIALLAHCNFDAWEMWHEFPKENPLPILQAGKCGPLWLRQFDRFIHPLTRVPNLPLTVDTHIVDMTERIYGPGVDDEETIREIWADYCEDRNVTLADVDNVLWRIRESNNWETVGNSYMKSLLGSRSSRD